MIALQLLDKFKIVKILLGRAQLASSLDQEDGRSFRQISVSKRGRNYLRTKVLSSINQDSKAPSPHLNTKITKNAKEEILRAVEV
jgi:hypothetical protein